MNNYQVCRNSSWNGILTDLKGGYKLRKCNQKKIEVEEELELFVENDRQKGECVVFLVPDDIGWKACL